MYFYGDGVPEDYTEAEKWLEKATENGNEDAKSLLLYLLELQINTLSNKITNSDDY